MIREQDQGGWKNVKEIYAKSFRSLSVLLFCLLILTYSAKIDAVSSLDVVINEIAWMGTESSSSDEWIEFYNNTDSSIDIGNWSIYGADTGECLNFSDTDDSSTMTIPANGYLIYANHEDDVKDSNGTNIVDIWDKTIRLNNTSPGQVILYDAPNCGGDVIDIANQSTGDWFAGNAGDRKTMERKDPTASGTDESNWATSTADGPATDSSGTTTIKGTPKAENSVKNLFPQADAGGPYSCDVGETITLDGSGSSDSDGTIASYEWAYDDDGQYDDATVVSPSYSCSTAGSHTVGLKVTDDGSATDTDSTTVNVNSPPTANFSHSPSNPTTQDSIQFTDQSTDSDGTIASWNWNFGDGNTSTTQNPPHKYANEGTYTVTLTVTDDDGATDTSTKEIAVGEPLSSGDCDGDGEITMEDAQLAAEYALGLKTPTDAQKEAADVVALVGVIDIRDAIAIAEVAQGLRSGF